MQIYSTKMYTQIALRSYDAVKKKTGIITIYVNYNNNKNEDVNFLVKRKAQLILPENYCEGL